MNIVTGVNQTCGKLQRLRAQELSWDLMELTAHAGARPEHAEWQGRIVSLSGKSGYLSLKDIGYGEATGFKGVNCNHDWMPFYEGSTRTYTDRELEKLANETITYNGQEMSKYKAQQIQRGMERKIRQDKKEIAGLQGILTSTNKDDELLEKARTSLANMQAKVKQHNSELNDFLEQTKFRKDATRLQIGKIGVTKNVKDDIMAKTPNFRKALLKDEERLYSKKEIKQIANEMYQIANKYTENASKWSGTINISNRRVNAKLWNCNIEIERTTSPHAILHEQLHAHSISYYDRETYKKYRNIEEATVELLAKEISKKENIMNVASEYDGLVDSLKEINKSIHIKRSDLEFAQKLFNIPLDKRLNFLENKIEKYLRDKEINEAIKINKLMEVLYD